MTWVWLVCFGIYGDDVCVVCIGLIGLVWILRGGWRGVGGFGFPSTSFVGGVARFSFLCGFDIVDASVVWVVSGLYAVFVGIVVFSWFLGWGGVGDFLGCLGLHFVVWCGCE